ncbi:MAG TPA: hypothetical protein VNZ26_02200, partial [Vicinamibacterales bacterium]|nr:hypothetical protein [Vicinamibacterales bacterium]
MTGTRTRASGPSSPPLFAAALLAVVLQLIAQTAWAQETPPRIGPYVFDLQMTIPNFPQVQQLADSRNMSLSELPGSGIGLLVGAHIYPVRWRAITFGLGGELTVNRARQTLSIPASADGTIQAIRPSTEKFSSVSPQLSFNFGSGHGWSYLTGGFGYSTWSLIPEGQDPFPIDSARVRTINYGGGARWFKKRHLAFSFDVRFYAFNPIPGSFGHADSPRTT